ncbi:MAG: UbiA prenyltransferase family protein, partial [Candidatus Krumholzibacteriia bacterium]
MSRKTLEAESASPLDAGHAATAMVAARSAPVQMFLLLLREMRVRQWSKNLILFAGLIFSKNLLHGSMVLRSTAAFAVFCLLSGVVYTINDLLDLEADRMHETKRKRPLASGLLPVRVTLLWSIFVLAVALTAAGVMGIQFLFISVGFLAFNFAYSLYLKNVVIVDVISISISFLIRAIAGVIALNTLGTSLTISPWLLVVTFFLSFFLGLCKRRHEFRSMVEAGQHRTTLAAYSEDLLN